MMEATSSRSGAIGVVVIGRNEGARLADCLRSIAPSASRIVYADSGSTDGSRELAEKLGAFVVLLDESAPHTAARGRREGLAALLRLHPDCEFVQFVDGDCILDPHWIPTAAAFLASNPQVAVVCGRRKEMYPEASPYNRLCDDEWNTPVGEAEACGGDSLMRIGAVRQVGGFRPDLRAGEEPELCSRLRGAGWKIWRMDADMTKHDAAILHFGQWWRRALRGGFGYAQVNRVTAGGSHPLYGRQIRSAAIWVAGIPLAAAVAAVITGSAAFLLIAPLLWALQIARIAARRGIASGWSWQRAALLMMAKVPELIGAIRYLLRRERSAPLEYKASA